MNSGIRTGIKKRGIEAIEESLANEVSTAIVSDPAKTPQDQMLLARALAKHFLFSTLGKQNQVELIAQMRLFALGQEETVFEQGVPGQYFFIVRTGSLSVTVNHRPVKDLRPGDSFGELALIHGSARSATVSTKSPTELWAIDRASFRSAIALLHNASYQTACEFVHSVPLFQLLSIQQKDALVGSLVTLNFQKDEPIVNEGDPGDLFFLITSGSVVCQRGDEELRKLYTGDFFGEQALLHNTPRTASVTALAPTSCLVIGRTKLFEVLGDHLERILYRNSLRMALEKSELMERLTNYQISEILPQFTIKKLRRGEEIVFVGQPKDQALVIILNGAARSGTNQTFGPLECIGDTDICSPNSGKHSATIVANSEDTTVGELCKSTLEKILGSSMTEAEQTNQALQVLKKVQAFIGIPESKLRQIMAAFHLLHYQVGDKIVSEGSKGDSFYLIQQGEVEVWQKGKLVRTLTKLDYFGERSVLLEEDRTATVKAKTDIGCWVLAKEEFHRLVDNNLKQQLMRRIELQDTNVELKDLVAVDALGQGSFGSVYLVAHRTNKRLYALKSIQRSQITRLSLHERILAERQILMQLDHTFIVKLIKTLKDESRIYYLLEYVRGMDLFDVIRELGLLTEDAARFYSACLVTTLEYLHERNLLYRDLKPENIVVDQVGYTKLIDFGTAKTVLGRTYTVIGTPHYIAPEVIVGKGYGSAVDLWSLGVMAYEFVCGRLPFGEDDTDPYAVYEKILAHRLVYPSYVNPQLKAKIFIEQLLNKSPVMRGTASLLKSHHWFVHFDWERLLTRELAAPYTPALPSLSIEEALSRGETVTEILDLDEDTVDEDMGRKAPALSDWDEEF